MKRNVTQFERKLLDNGWKMIYKTYKGKNSQFVWTYVYLKHYDNFLFKVALDKKRESTLGIYIENFKTDYLDISQLKALNETYLKVSDEIHQLEFGVSLDNEQEIIEIVESENE